MDIKKILLIGLNNAGKSTITDVLTGKIKGIPPAPPDKKPTVSVKIMKIKIFGKKISLWDFGGQALYRADYINNPEHYFQEASTIFYVVDVQDTETLKETIMYFKVLLPLMMKCEPI